MELAGSLKGTPSLELEARARRLAAQAAAAPPRLSQEEELALLDHSPDVRFEVDVPAWLEHLDKEGYVVLAAVASSAEVEQAKHLLWTCLAKVGWRRGAPDTWTDERMDRNGVGSVRNGIVSGAGIGHSEFLWYLRTLPAVRKAFEAIWKTSDLLVSFDGCNVFRPWQHGFRKTQCGWWHTDQGRAKKGRHSVQGFVSLHAADGATGGLTVLPRSHARHQEALEDQQNPESDYYALPYYSHVLLESSRKLVCCQAGDLVLWDSRTVHANAPALLLPKGPANELLRAVGYVCMTPYSFASEQVRKVRRASYEAGCSTSHWPHKLDLGSAGGKPAVSLAEASAEIRALVG